MKGSLLVYKHDCPQLEFQTTCGMGVLLGLHWQSDFNGEDYGYPDVEVVGVYSWVETGLTFLIDMDKGVVLEVYQDEEEDDTGVLVCN